LFFNSFARIEQASEVTSTWTGRSGLGVQIRGTCERVTRLASQVQNFSS